MNQNTRTLFPTNNPNLYKSIRTFFVFVLLAFSVEAVNAQTFYVDWTGTSASLTQPFVLPDGTTGTLVKTNTTCEVGSSGFEIPLPQSLPYGGAQPNYPSNFFSPTPPNPLEFMRNGFNRDSTVAGCASGTAVVTNMVFNFSETVANVRFHFLNLDAGTYRFFDSTMTPINVTRRSGNDDFEVTGNAVNSTPLAATGFGCDTVPNTPAAPACGSIAVPGKYTQLRITGTDSVDSAAGGDGHWFTMSLFADYGDAPATYDNNGVNEASHDLLAANLRLGATVDADSAEKSGATALGDDTTGSDDEDGVTGTFQPYIPAGGRTCTGTLGAYTTLANEYCAVISVTNTGATEAQLVGWLDANGDGDFLGANDRSVPLNDPAVDDGTFATGNIPAATTRNVIVVWTGLPPTLPSTRYFRFRVTRDATFFSNPQPLGAMIDGEVEDYANPARTAASVSVSGRVLAPNSRGIAGALVTLTNAQGVSQTARSSSFGYYRFDEVPAGETYLLSATAKSYQFMPQAVTVSEDIADLNITALE